MRRLVTGSAKALLPQMKKFWIYLGGVFTFGLAYEWLQTTMTESVFFAGAIGYLLLLRLTAERLGR